MTQPQDREAVAKDAVESHEKGMAESERQAQEAEQRDRDEDPEPRDPFGPPHLSGDELNAGALAGTNSTSNESRAVREPGEVDYVTGADGVPLPAEGNDPEMPGAVRQEGPRGLPDDVQQAERREQEQKDAAAEREHEHDRDETEGVHEMREAGMPVADVADVPNENTGQSPGVNDQ